MGCLTINIKDLTEHLNVKCSLVCSSFGLVPFLSIYSKEGFLLFDKNNLALLAQLNKKEIPGALYSIDSYLLCDSTGLVLCEQTELQEFEMLSADNYILCDININVLIPKKL